jgi:hypothetical protein
MTNLAGVVLKEIVITSEARNLLFLLAPGKKQIPRRPEGLLVMTNLNECNGAPEGAKPATQILQEPA